MWWLTYAVLIITIIIPTLTFLNWRLHWQPNLGLLFIMLQIIVVIVAYWNWQRTKQARIRFEQIHNVKKLPKWAKDYFKDGVD